MTKAAIVSFQRRRGLSVDGVVGPQTRRAFGKRGRPAFGSRTMKKGDRGWDVAAMQYILARRGYPPGAIDAVFGPMTDTALRNFQRAYGLTADGLAGPQTISALRRGSASRGTTPVAHGPVRLLRPVPGPIGDRFGARRSGGRTHTGIDFPVASGTRIGAAGVGVTEFAGWNTAATATSSWSATGSATPPGTPTSRRSPPGSASASREAPDSATWARPATPPARTSTSSCAGTPCRSTRSRTCSARSAARASSGGGVAARACPIRKPLVRYRKAPYNACRAKNLTRAR